MNWWQAVILGLVEGITEYLPVSSTGHLIIARALLGLDGPENRTAMDAFIIVVQGGAILAVLGLYRERVAQMIRGVLGRDPAGFRLAVNLAIAFMPAAVLGLALERIISERLFSPGPVIAALMLGGVYMMLLERWRRGRIAPATGIGAHNSADRPGPGVPQRPAGWGERDIESLSPAGALAIGFLQCIAMWPGMSRSMMTITGGMIVGLRPVAAAEFSFLLGLPTLSAACIYKLIKDQMNAGRTGDDGAVQLGMFQQLGAGPVVIGLVVATVSAMLAVRWLVGFLNRHGLTAFGWYRILVGLTLTALLAGGVMEWVG